MRRLRRWVRERNEAYFFLAGSGATPPIWYRIFGRFIK